MKRYTRNLKENELAWILVDLDDTIAKRIWPKKGIGPILKGAIESLKKLTDKGFKIIIYTARPWSDYYNIEKWLIENSVPFRRILCGKPLARYVIDDLNIEFDGDWDKAINKILKKR